MPVFEESMIDGLVFGQNVDRIKVMTFGVTNPLYFGSSTTVYTQSIDPIYGTITGAENYFKSKIIAQILDWLDATLEDKMAALRQATNIIESLNFKGTSYNPNQLLFFPIDEKGVPADIQKACYEIALQLLKGVDPDTEVINLMTTSQGYAGGRSSYDRTFVQEHIRAGVPSAYAWTILRPYLCDPNGLRLRRGD